MREVPRVIGEETKAQRGEVTFPEQGKTQSRPLTAQLLQELPAERSSGCSQSSSHLLLGGSVALGRSLPMPLGLNLLICTRDNLKQSTFSIVAGTRLAHSTGSLPLPSWWIPREGGLNDIY